MILLFKFLSPLEFFSWCFLTFLLKTVEQNNKFPRIKKTKYSKNVRAGSYTQLVERICTRYML